MSWKAVAEFSSTVIALCAFGLTIWQACITRKHNKLSVTPHLTTWMHSDKAKNIYAVELLNNGIGPALIDSFQIQVDSHPIVGEGTEPMEKALKILFPQYQYSSWQSFVSKGYMMSEKETRNLVTIQFHGEKLPKPEEVEHATKRAQVIIEYQSIYKDKSTLNTSAFRANPAVQGTLRDKAAQRP